MALFIERLSPPLLVSILTADGKLIGRFQSTHICEVGIFIDGDNDDLMDTMRMLDMTTCMVEMQLPHRRPLRCTVRVGLQSLSRNSARKNMRVFLRFVRMNSDYRRRYDELLYACPAACL